MESNPPKVSLIMPITQTRNIAWEYIQGEDILRNRYLLLEDETTILCSDCGTKYMWKKKFSVQQHEESMHFHKSKREQKVKTELKQKRNNKRQLRSESLTNLNDVDDFTTPSKKLYISTIIEGISSKPRQRSAPLNNISDYIQQIRNEITQPPTTEHDEEVDEQNKLSNDIEERKPKILEKEFQINSDRSESKSDEKDDKKIIQKKKIDKAFKKDEKLKILYDSFFKALKNKHDKKNKIIRAKKRVVRFYLNFCHNYNETPTMDVAYDFLLARREKCLQIKEKWSVTTIRIYSEYLKEFLIKNKKE